jgi:hypothetical protein
MLMNNNSNKVENKVDALEASKKLMEDLMTRKIVVKPTLGIGHYTTIFKGISFIETRHKGQACMAVRISYELDSTVYDEDFALDGTGTPEAQQAQLGQIQRYMQQIGEQFNLIGIDITMDLLNEHIGQSLDVKVYDKEFETKGNKIAKARRVGFWLKPVEVNTEVAADSAVPRF